MNLPVFDHVDVARLSDSFDELYSKMIDGRTVYHFLTFLFPIIGSTKLEEQRISNLFSNCLSGNGESARISGPGAERFFTECINTESELMGAVGRGQKPRSRVR